MQDNFVFIGVWILCGVATVVSAVFANRSAAARYVGRAATAVLFLVGGALLHVLNLVSGDDYSGFADPAHFGWVTVDWQLVVVPNPILFIGLLAVFEAVVGVLVISGDRWTQLGYAAVIAFYLALWLFGWIETVWCLVMLPAMVLLLQAEQRTRATASVAMMS